MAFNINQFRSRFKKSSPAHFQVKFALPELVLDTPDFEQIIIQGGTETLAYSAKSVAFPSRSLSTYDYRSYGPISKKPIERVEEALSVTFYNTENLQERLIFEAWVNLIYDPFSHTLAYESSYKRDLTVEKFDVSGNVEAEYKFYDAFPILLGSITYDWETVNTVAIFNVDMGYLEWERTR